MSGIQLIVVDEDDKKDEKYFRLASNVILITYGKVGESIKLEKDSLIKFIKGKVGEYKNLHVKDILVAHELYKEEKARYHTHVVLRFDDDLKCDIRNPRVFDYLGLHPNIAGFVKSLWKQKWNYLCKEDPENLDKKIEENFVLNIWKAESLPEAFQKNCNKPSDAAGVKLIFQNRQKIGKKKFVLKEDELYPWQTILNRELKNEPDNRKIIWYVDKVGGSGKSEFGTFLSNNYPNRFLRTSWINYKDGATLIKGAIEGGWNSHGVIVDLTRDRESFQGSIYSFLEGLKDGNMTVSKYESTTIEFDSPWVIVFANWMPDKSKLSEDRWDIRFLDKKSQVDAPNIKIGASTGKSVKESLADLSGKRWFTKNDG